ncbi:MAG: oxidoreductase [Gordonia sp. (in: high G+C Gram-positive bacteria)]|uniref:oxidoreductase n=1 Tax=Gordonia sp. (in: high G+C Gram-positive bacteria) TaxID=84139 RepID=UPI0039E2EBDF
MTSDPLAPLLDLPGVAAAAEEAGEALAAVHRHPVNLRGWDKTSRESSWRGGRSSAAMEGATTELNREHDFDDPVMSGAIRVAQAMDPDSLDREVAVFRRAPMQSLARLHALAAAELVPESRLGRPREEPHIAQRLDFLGQLITGATSVPAAVLAAVVHGELLVLAPFEEANAVVARGASRLVSAATGLDPHLLGVPEVTWLRRLGDYRESSASFATGDPLALADWIVLCCQGMASGAAEARSIADAAR